jgi:hypothetical protein
MIYYSPSVITTIKPKDQTEELQDIVVQQTKGDIFYLIEPKDIKSDEIFKKAIIMKPYNIRNLEIDGNYGVSVLNRILDENLLKQLFDKDIAILYYKSVQDKITKEVFSYIYKKYNYEILTWLDEIDKINKKNGIYIDNNFLINIFNEVPSDEIFHYFTKIIDYLLSKNKTNYTYPLIDELLNIGIKKDGDILHYLARSYINSKFKNSMINKYIEPALLNASNYTIIDIFAIKEINNSKNFEILIKAIKQNKIFKNINLKDLTYFSKTQQAQIHKYMYQIYNKHLQ